MNPEVEDSEMKKYAAQQELMAILDKKEEIGAPLQRLTVENKTPTDVSKTDHLFDFADLMAPKMRDAQILDLFCGANSFKTYAQEHTFPGQVTGVDIQSDKADIKADVAKIDQVLPPAGQFDILTSCGSVPGIEDYETSARYLRPDGLYVMGASLEWMNEEILPFINNPELIDKMQLKYQAEARKFLTFFEPTVVVDTLRTSLEGQPDTSSSYLICHKREQK